MPSFNIEAPLAEKTQSDQDNFLLGFHGGHTNEELKAMSYVQLCSEMELATPETTRYMLLETEKRLRDSIKPSEPPKTKEDHGAQEATTPPNTEKNWHEKPLGNIALSVAGATLALLVAYLLSKHFGIAP